MEEQQISPNRVAWYKQSFVSTVENAINELNIYNNHLSMKKRSQDLKNAIGKTFFSFYMYIWLQVPRGTCSQKEAYLN